MAPAPAAIAASRAAQRVAAGNARANDQRQHESHRLADEQHGEGGDPPALQAAEEVRDPPGDARAEPERYPEHCPSAEQALEAEPGGDRDRARGCGPSTPVHSPSRSHARVAGGHRPVGRVVDPDQERPRIAGRQREARRAKRGEPVAASARTGEVTGARDQAGRVLDAVEPPVLVAPDRTQVGQAAANQRLLVRRQIVEASRPGPPRRRPRGRRATTDTPPAVRFPPVNRSKSPDSSWRSQPRASGKRGAT